MTQTSSVRLGKRTHGIGNRTGNQPKPGAGTQAFAPAEGQVRIKGVGPVGITKLHPRLIFRPLIGVIEGNILEDGIIRKSKILIAGQHQIVEAGPAGIVFGVIAPVDDVGRKAAVPGICETGRDGPSIAVLILRKSFLVEKVVVKVRPVQRDRSL